MFAIAFDLVVADTAQKHPKGVSQAYADIGATLGPPSVLTGFRVASTQRHRRIWPTCLGRLLL
jgi:virulence-associated protein VapD